MQVQVQHYYSIVMFFMQMHVCTCSKCCPEAVDQVVSDTRNIRNLEVWQEAGPVPVLSAACNKVLGRHDYTSPSET